GLAGSHQRGAAQGGGAVVGWVERKRNPPAELQVASALMGFAALNPSYASAALLAQRDVHAPQLGERLGGLAQLLLQVLDLLEAFLARHLQRLRDRLARVGGGHGAV